MCGIVGVMDSTGYAERLKADVHRGTRAIAHRGPDDDGFFFDGPIGLGFRRLSILDLSAAGHQPMSSADGNWTLVFNGEIYNFLELAEELRGQGVAFRSGTDTEVLVEALAHWGVHAFERCNGMWAVLAWHAPTGTLYACRDPWAIKPLYHCRHGGSDYFASEIKALRAMRCDLGGVDPVAARRYVDSGELDTDTRSLYANVRRLEPGTLYRYRVGQPVRASRYADGTDTLGLDVPVASARAEEEMIERFRDAFLTSVRLRLRADVPVGSCLSGGLDSTAITCATAQFLSGDRTAACRHAFTALFAEFDESRYIAPVVRRTGVEWHVTVASDQHLLAKVETFFDVHDEPVHSLAAFAGFLVMELAAKAQVKVLLNGQGSDEMLAGYDSSVVPYLRSLLQEDGMAPALDAAIAEGGSVRSGLVLLASAKAGLLRRALPAELEARVRARMAHDRNAPKFLRQDGLFAEKDPLQQTTATLQAALGEQVRRGPLPLYLRIEDANSSALSLEARLPFLDPALLSIARVAPARLLRRDGANKYLLRRILPGLVPDVVWKRRDKMGFPVPHARWLRGPLRDMLLDTLAADRLHARGWYDVSKVLAHRDRFLASPEPKVAPQLLRVFLLERWARHHLDRAP